RKIGQDTKLPSLELSSETTVQQAAGNGGFYTTVSFRDATSPLPMEYNPKKVFNQLFGETTPKERVEIARQTDSLLDLIIDGTKALHNKLGAGDRVASYIMVAEGTNQTYNHIGIPDSFHPVSHHANDLERINKLVKIQTWHMDRFAAFLKKMAETADGDGTLLDHSIFMYGSNMGN